MVKEFQLPYNFTNELRECLHANCCCQSAHTMTFSQIITFKLTIYKLGTVKAYVAGEVPQLLLLSTPTDCKISTLF